MDSALKAPVHTGIRINSRRLLKRRLFDLALRASAYCATAFGLFWLSWILWITFSKGLPGLNLAIFTQMTPPPGEATGGIANALMGSLMMCLSGIALATPIGVAAGVFLAEYAKNSKTGAVIRFFNDVLLSAPSIVVGLFMYILIVRTTGGFSGVAGALALAMIAIPVIVRTTDQMFQLLPQQMREAALSLGIPMWKMNSKILLRAALPGVVTGVLLALARISGETAPLLFTALSNQYWSLNMGDAMASVPVMMSSFANSPYEYWNQLAWTGALLISLFVLTTSIIARSVLARNASKLD